ncbi:hypothetical protein N7466_011221 [Penicillium verhagenii]|uniref:uncharacterized protein n=1 Tax=Penicillium verhagenii TaxID=1562060 RepID=UPI00254592B8|nr:uncharacterized protein N7466_011221 [Penicillium verhagenii]KAJ5917667.1 hypothetical protein N7466_011221 [Penicillium verhagenii]
MPASNTMDENIKIEDDCLNHCIDTASDTLLRTLLKTICETIPAAKEKVVENLLVEKNKVPIPPSSDSDSDQESNDEGSDEEKGSEDDETASAEKRPAQETTSSAKRPRYAECEVCNKQFDVLLNSETACRYHEKEACVEDDSPLFWDNDFFGPMEAETDPHIREEYPEYFKFECCGGNLMDNPDGCKTGWHKEASSYLVAMSAKKRRLI